MSCSSLCSISNLGLLSLSCLLLECSS
jgi:hypothetical protein